MKSSMKNSLSPIQKIVAAKTFDSVHDRYRHFGGDYHYEGDPVKKNYNKNTEAKNFYKRKNVRKDVY